MPCIVGAQNNPVVAVVWNGNSQVGDRVGGVKVKSKHQWATPKDKLLGVFVQQELLD